VVRNNFW